MALRGVLLVLAAVMVALALDPHLDLAASALFYRPDSGFFLKEFWLFRWLYKGVGWIVALPVLFLLGALAYQTLHPQKRLRKLTPKAIAYMITALFIGPLLVTNLLLKEYYGRARPLQVEAFGGSKTFTPFYEPAHQCLHNCSFVSGHVAASLVVLLFAFVFRSRALLWAGLGFAALMGVARLAQGAHFLSDVLGAVLINFAIFWLLYAIFFREVPRFE